MSTATPDSPSPAGSATPIERRPGLSRLPSRGGSHAEVRQRLLTALTSLDRPGLSGLSGDDGDWTAGFLDAVAVMSDVLSFYGDRILGESFLRTATERVSLRELARLVGFELRPGQAASVPLAFTLETAPGAPTEVVLPAGLRVSGLPGTGGTLPPVYETVEEAVARGEWNALRPGARRPLRPADVAIGDVAVVRGVATGLRPGDTLLVVAGATLTRTLRKVLRVAVDPAAGTTRFDLVPVPAVATAPGAAVAVAPATDEPDLPPARPLTGPAVVDRDWVAEHVLGVRWSQPDLETQLAMLGVAPDVLTTAVRATPAVPPPLTEVVDGLPRREGLFALTTTASVFGHNAPAAGAGDVPGLLETDVERSGAARDLVALFLDAEYPALTTGSWVALTAPAAPPLTLQVHENVPSTRSAFGLAARVSRLTLRRAEPFPPAFTTRGTVLLGGSADPVELADVPVTADVAGSVLDLDDVHLGLRPGRRVVVSGERADLDGVIEAEVVRLAGVELVGGRTVVRFASPLRSRYRRNGVTLNANIAEATHGETVRRVLGSGDSGAAFQRFPLIDRPLTVLGGSSRSTLEVRVDGVAWREVESLSDAGPHDPVFALRHGEDGATDVLFGDGVTGTRLPTGTENVVAVYRKGIGLAGLAAPGELTLLTTRPAGVRAVTNPVAAAGAADPDGVEDARRTAPLVARTLDRVVSLRDYEDVARARPGVAKVQATLAWRAGRRAVLLTVAGARGARFDETGLDATGLRAAIAAVADPAVPVDVRSFTAVFFQVAATVRVAAGHDAVTVLTAATVRLRDAFAFERREFGQPVAASQVVAVLQATAGVVAVDLDRFHRADQASPELADRLPARLARRAGPATVGAELLLLDPRPPELGVQP